MSCSYGLKRAKCRTNRSKLLKRPGPSLPLVHNVNPFLQRCAFTDASSHHTNPTAAPPFQLMCNKYPYSRELPLSQAIFWSNWMIGRSNSCYDNEKVTCWKSRRKSRARNAVTQPILKHCKSRRPCCNWAKKRWTAPNNLREHRRGQRLASMKHNTHSTPKRWRLLTANGPLTTTIPG